jgi:hypothetical protein
MLQVMHRLPFFSLFLSLYDERNNRSENAGTENGISTLKTRGGSVVLAVRGMRTSWIRILCSWEVNCTVLFTVLVNLNSQIWIGRSKMTENHSTVSIPFRSSCSLRRPLRRAHPLFCPFPLVPLSSLTPRTSAAHSP